MLHCLSDILSASASTAPDVDTDQALSSLQDLPGDQELVFSEMLLADCSGQGTAQFATGEEGPHEAGQEGRHAFRCPVESSTVQGEILDLDLTADDTEPPQIEALFCMDAPVICETIDGPAEPEIVAGPGVVPERTGLPDSVVITVNRFTVSSHQPGTEESAALRPMPEPQTHGPVESRPMPASETPEPAGPAAMHTPAVPRPWVADSAPPLVQPPPPVADSSVQAPALAAMKPDLVKTDAVAPHEVPAGPSIPASHPAVIQVSGSGAEARSGIMHATVQESQDSTGGALQNVTAEGAAPAQEQQVEVVAREENRLRPILEDAEVETPEHHQPVSSIREDAAGSSLSSDGHPAASTMSQEGGSTAEGDVAADERQFPDVAVDASHAHRGPSVHASSGVPEGDATGATQRLEEVVERFGEYLERVTDGRGRTLTIDLAPPHLGRLVLSCREVGGEVSFELFSSSRSAREYLEEHETFIRDIIQDSGFRFSGFEVKPVENAGAGESASHDTGMTSGNWSMNGREAGSQGNGRQPESLQDVDEGQERNQARTKRALPHGHGGILHLVA